MRVIMSIGALSFLLCVCCASAGPYSDTNSKLTNQDLAAKKDKQISKFNLNDRFVRENFRRPSDTMQDEVSLTVNNQLINQGLAPKKLTLNRYIERLPNTVANNLKDNFSRKRRFLLFNRKPPVLPKDLIQTGITLQINNDSVSIN